MRVSASSSYCIKHISNLSKFKVAYLKSNFFFNFYVHIFFQKLALKCIRTLRTKKKDERVPLVCQICKNKSFTAQATLMYHYRSHAGKHRNSWRCCHWSLGPTNIKLCNEKCAISLRMLEAALKYLKCSFIPFVYTYSLIKYT